MSPSLPPLGYFRGVIPDKPASDEDALSFVALHLKSRDVFPVSLCFLW